MLAPSPLQARGRIHGRAEHAGGPSGPVALQPRHWAALHLIGTARNSGTDKNPAVSAHSCTRPGPRNHANSIPGEVATTRRGRRSAPSCRSPVSLLFGNIDRPRVGDRCHRDPAGRALPEPGARGGREGVRCDGGCESSLLFFSAPHAHATSEGRCNSSLTRCGLCPTVTAVKVGVRRHPLPVSQRPIIFPPHHSLGSLLSRRRRFIFLGLVREISLIIESVNYPEPLFDGRYTVSACDTIEKICE